MGVDSKTGEPIFRDIDGVEGITDNDKTEIGKGIADYTYGITLNAAWKGFDFILFGTGSQGNDVFCGLNRVDYNLNQLTYFTKTVGQKAIAMGRLLHQALQIIPSI